MGDTAFAKGDFENARRYYEAILDTFKENQSDQFSGSTMKRYGLTLLRTGRIEEARQNFEKSIVQMEKVGQGHNTEMSWFGLGDLERMAGNIPVAQKNYQQALFLRNKFQRYIYTPEIFDGFAKLSLLQNDFVQSARWFGFTDALRSRFEMIIPPVDRPDYDKYLELLKNQMSGEEFQPAWEAGAKMDMNTAVTIALQGYEP